MAAMNYIHLALASLGGTLAYFVYGFGLFAAWPSLQTEFLKYPNIYRPKDEMMKKMPFGMIGIVLSIVVAAILYAEVHVAGGGIVPGASFGALLGVFMVCVFVVHNYVNLNIGLKLTVYQGIVYFVQWVIVGAAIGLIYRP